MERQIRQLIDFNKAFEVPVNESPSFLFDDTFKLGVKLQKEELDEYIDAHKNGDMVEIADALVDEMFILIGRIVKHGLQDSFVELFDEVYLSNMSKLEDGKVIRRIDGKILKGKNYFKPRIKEILDSNYGS